MNLGGIHGFSCGVGPNHSSPMFLHYLLESLEHVCFEENERNIQNMWVCRTRGVSIRIIEPLSS
jgi:hypothetical protein